jgi:predicted nucleotidyltransferase
MPRATAGACQPQHLFHHYLHMALGNWTRCSGRDPVHLKRYFYVLRPLLAALWIEREGTWPPMPFHELFDALVTDPGVREAVDALLEHKRRVGEAREGKPVPAIDAWIEVQLQRLAMYRPATTVPDFSVPDRLLFDTVMDERD